MLVALDSFKGTLSSAAAGRAAARGLCLAIPRAQVTVALLADGGEGTAAALAVGLRARWVRSRVENAVGRPVRARWAWVESARLGIADMASAAGLAQLEPALRDPLRTHTRGVGRLLVAMARRGVRRVWLGAGGSATVDGGMGAAEAMGILFTDAGGRRLAPAGGMLERIAAWTPARLPGAAGKLEIDIIADVANPLTGVGGAARVFGPQKGAGPAAVRRLDAGLGHLAGLLEPRGETPSLDSTPGMGAAGGLPLCLVALGGARLCPGAAFVIRHTGLAKAVAGCDLVITGEGRYDRQSASGKGPWTLASLALEAGAKVLVVSGLPPRGAPRLEGVDVVAAGSDVPVPGRAAAVRIE
ncbi:glycerate kinase, partial [bacterium]|nr:glycerate kinase [bacterium]